MAAPSLPDTSPFRHLDVKTSTDVRITLLTTITDMSITVSTRTIARHCGTPKGEAQPSRGRWVVIQTRSDFKGTSPVRTGPIALTQRLTGALSVEGGMGPILTVFCSGVWASMGHHTERLSGSLVITLRQMLV